MNLQNAVDKVTIETRFTPPIVLDKPLAGGAPNPLLQFLQPRITVDTPLGQSKTAPYGDPVDNQWPLVKLVGTVLLVVAVRQIIKGVRK